MRGRTRHRGGGGPLGWGCIAKAPTFSWRGGREEGGTTRERSGEPLLEGTFRLQSTLAGFISSDRKSFLLTSSFYRRKRPSAKAFFKVRARRVLHWPVSRLPARGRSGSNRCARHSRAANRRRAAHLLRGPQPRPPPGRGLRAPAARLCSWRRRCWASGLGEERTPPVRMVLESVARIVKVQLPAYLKGLPVPESITGFARLTGNPHLHPLLLLVRSPRRRRGWGRGASKNPQAKGRGGARRVARDPVTLRRVGAAAEGRECCLLGPGGWAGCVSSPLPPVSAGVRRRGDRFCPETWWAGPWPILPSPPLSVAACLWSQPPCARQSTAWVCVGYRPDVQDSFVS